MGSSPRVWGQVERRAKVFVDIRIIPTRVGTSYVCKQNEGTQQDHPHACGDKLFLTQYQRQQIGSSPRVWGQDAKYSVCCPSVRIIPTRVGTSKHTITLVNGNKDHPHACGDKELFKGDENYHEGSSPRVWGQDANTIRSIGNVRIIPTRVGTRHLS